jgi:hypothetical protein
MIWRSALVFDISASPEAACEGPHYRAILMTAE